MNFKTDFLCLICNKIRDEPVLLPCACSSVCMGHVNDALKSRENAITCLICHQTYKIPSQGFEEHKQMKQLIEKSSFLSLEEKKLKSNIEYLHNECEKVSFKLNQTTAAFTLTQYEHFMNIRRDIDIRRETLLSHLFHSTKYKDKERKLIQDNLNRQSFEMIKRVEELEEAFRLNFIRISKSKLMIFDAKEECNNLKEFFRQSNLKLEHVRKLKVDVEQRLRIIKANLNNFKLFEYDLIRNRFLPSSPSSSSRLLNEDDFNLGSLQLYDNFIQSLYDDVDVGACENIITCHWTLKDINICNMKLDTMVKRLPFPALSGVYCLVVYETTKVIIGTAEKTILVVDIVTDTLEQTLSGHTREVLCLKLLKASGLLASGSWDHLIKIWNLKESKCLFTLNSQIEHSVYCIDQLPDGLLIAGSGDNRIRIWDLDRKCCVSILVGHSNDVKCLKTLNEKNLFASGSADGTIRIWNPNIDECVRKLEGHSGKVFCIDILSTTSSKRNNHQRLLVSCSSDRTIRVWNMDFEYECVYLFCEHTEPVYCVKIDACGHLLSSSADKCIKKWNLSTGECLSTLKCDASIWKFDLCSMF